MIQRDRQKMKIDDQAYLKIIQALLNQKTEWSNLPCRLYDIEFSYADAKHISKLLDQIYNIVRRVHINISFRLENLTKQSLIVHRSLHSSVDHYDTCFIGIRRRIPLISSLCLHIRITKSWISNHNGFHIDLWDNLTREELEKEQDKHRRTVARMRALVRYSKFSNKKRWELTGKDIYKRLYEGLRQLNIRTQETAYIYRRNEKMVTGIFEMKQRLQPHKLLSRIVETLTDSKLSRKETDTLTKRLLNMTGNPK